MRRLGIGTAACFASALAIVGGPATAAAAPGDLDTSFGGTGIVTTAIGATALGRAVLEQPDGKLVVVGSGLGGSDFALARYHANGALDAGFGSGGIVTTSFTAGNDAAVAAVLQPDGRIVAAGLAGGTGPAGAVALARYTSSGALDPTFGTGGRVTTTVSAQADGANALALLPDGRLVIAGYANGTFSSGSLLVARYLANGNLDPSFDGDGIATVTPRTANLARGVAVQPNGAVVAVGFTYSVALGGDFLVVRFAADGSLDPTFDGDGIAATDVNGSDEAYAVKIQPDGALVVGGPVLPSGDFSLADFGLVRYLPSGALDPSFGSGGKVQTTVGPSTDRVFALALQADGKILAAGESRSGSDADIALARYEADGDLDATFGSGGLVFTHAGTLNDIAYGLTLQSDGRIVVAGGNGGFVAARYLGDAPPPTPAPVPAELLAGKKLILKDAAGAPQKRKLVLLSKDASISLGSGNGSGDDPTLHGATLRVVSAAAGFDDTYALPAANWAPIGPPGAGKGYKYKDAALAGGPVAVAALKPGGPLKIVAKGSALLHALGADPQPVEIVLTAGAQRYCLSFGGTTQFKAGKQYKALSSSAAGACAP